MHVRPTVLLEGFFLILTPDSVRQSNQIRLPFGEGKTSPVAVEDVARVLAALLTDPQPHIGKIYHLTGPRSENMHFFAREFAGAGAHDHLSGHSGRALAGRAARARLAGSSGEPPRDDGRYAPRRPLRPYNGRRARANRTSTVARGGFRQEERGDVHRFGKSGDLVNA